MVNTCALCKTTDTELVTNGKSIVKPFDLSGRMFCDLNCFKSYYEKGHDYAGESILSPSEIDSIEKHENAWCAPLSDNPSEDSLQKLEARITALRMLQEEYRKREVIARRHVMKVSAKNDSDKVEFCRKNKVNSIEDFQKRKLTMRQQDILRYIKMHLNDEKIIAYLDGLHDGNRETWLAEITELRKYLKNGGK